jgi:hypothetical protein
MRAVVAISLLIPVVAHAGASQLVCPLVGGGLIQIDGLLDDWPAMRELTKSGADPRDASLALRCAYDDTTLFVAVNVTDDRLIRGRGGPEDRLILTFADSRLEVLPASGDAKLVARWLGTRAPRATPEVADSLQKHGWSVELSLPLSKIPGWTKGAPSLPFAVEHDDVDQATSPRVEETVATGPVMLEFEWAARTLKAFLDDQHLHGGDITVDTLAEMDGEPGVERVIVAGKLLGVLGEGYQFLALPVASPHDVLGVEIVDLGGTGRSSAVVRYREYGSGGSRDVLAVWNLRSDGFTRTFAHEIAKQVGNARLTNRWELVPRKGKQHGKDLVIQPGDTGGFTAASWNETPAADMAPILLPWGEKKQEVWHFENDGVSGG